MIIKYEEVQVLLISSCPIIVKIYHKLCSSGPPETIATVGGEREGVFCQTSLASIFALQHCHEVYNSNEAPTARKLELSPLVYNAIVFRRKPLRLQTACAKVGVHT